MLKRFPVILLLLALLACNADRKDVADVKDKVAQTESTFDKTKWRVKENHTYPYREQMLNYVVYNDSVRALDKDGLLELLGEPNRSSEGHLYYTISQKRLGFWPVHTKSLVIKLTDTDSIEWIRIHE